MSGAAIDDDMLERLLPLALVRAHTKTDDVPHVTDEQLGLYRQAAFEAAQLYTGIELTGPEFVTQAIPHNQGRPRSIALDRPALDGIVVLSEGMRSATLAVAPGATQIRISPDVGSIGGGMPGDADLGCSGDVVAGASIRYRVRQPCDPDLPADVKVGCLQFIGWLIGNPGDNTDVRSAADVRSASRASGAINTWRRHVTTMGF